MATIRVPGPPPQAFRKNRPISDLIKSQIKHFQHLEHKLQLTLPTKFSPHDLTTEAAASLYIAEMTVALGNRRPVTQSTPSLRVVPPSRPDTTPTARSAAPAPLKSTRQSNGIVLAASAAKRTRIKKHAPAKPAKRKL